MPIIQVQTNDRFLGQAQQNIANAVNPLLANPVLNGIVLTSVSLSSGDNDVPHKLGRKLQGWMIVRRRGVQTVYDKQDSNPHPDQTLLLNSSGGITIDLYVF